MNIIFQLDRCQVFQHNQRIVSYITYIIHYYKWFKYTIIHYTQELKILK